MHMDADLASTLTEHGLAAATGGVGALVAKEIISGIFKRYRSLEATAEARHNGTIERLLSEVELVRRSLDVWGERWTHAQKDAGETKQRVDTHDERINALETGHADLRARFEIISEAKDD